MVVIGWLQEVWCFCVEIVSDVRLEVEWEIWPWLGRDKTSR
jgi:hypothetical protein